jgi:hypothetical protein
MNDMDYIGERILEYNKKLLKMPVDEPKIPLYSETLSYGGLTDEEIRLEAVKLAKGGDMGCCSVDAILVDAKKIYDFIKGNSDAGTC